VGQTVINDGSSFISVCAEDFLSGSTAYFDVYIQLSSGRYLKLLHAGDAFSSDRLESYIKKGVTHFYIRKEVQEQFLSYCGHLTTMMLPAENISSEIKVSQTLNFGEQTMSFLEQQGISEERLKYAHKFVASVKSLIAQIKPSQASDLQHFLDDVSAHEHGVSTAMLAGLLANAVEITMTRPASIVGIAAFLHDVGLFKMPKGFRDEDESYLSPTEQKLFEKHPQIGAEILGKIRGIDPAAVQAVGQHHVRRNGKGFPQLHSVSVNRIAEIVGICDEFSHLLKKYQNKPSWSGILSELEAKVFPGFSRQIVYAFRSTFFPKTRQQEVRKNTAEVFAIA
jgi:putative nucleotidyltransferase with HDIG domain